MKELVAALAAIGKIAGAVRDFFAWLAGRNQYQHGRADERSDALAKQREQDRLAQEAREKAEAEHHANTGDTAFDSTFQRKD